MGNNHDNNNKSMKQATTMNTHSWHGHARIEICYNDCSWKNSGEKLFICSRKKRNERTMPRNAWIESTSGGEKFTFKFKIAFELGSHWFDANVSSVFSKFFTHFNVIDCDFSKKKNKAERINGIVTWQITGEKIVARYSRHVPVYLKRCLAYTKTITANNT